LKGGSSKGLKLADVPEDQIKYGGLFGRVTGKEKEWRIKIDGSHALKWCVLAMRACTLLLPCTRVWCVRTWRVRVAVVTSHS